jgi:class 3 adenylate cyclase/pimeloyl-ACP methyl ester carboxylesterase
MRIRIPRFGKGDRVDTGIPEIRWARTVDGACIAYQDIGAGPVTLVVAHGWVSHLEIYWEQSRYVRFLRRLSRDMRVLVFDKRGVGMSDRVTGTPDIGTLADDVRAVMDAAGVEKAALLGWGGPGPELPAFFAATHPERTLCLVLYGNLRARKGADYPGGVTEQELEAELASLLPTWGTLKGAQAFIRYGYLGEEPAEGSLPYTEPDFIAWNARLARFAATPVSYEAFERMWFETDVLALLPTISVPVGLLYSSLDAGPEEWATELALIPGAELVPFPGPSAIIWVFEPEPIVAATEQFIASVRHEEAALDRMLATVLFTDIVGSTAKACELGDAHWKELLGKHQAVVRAYLNRYRGNEVKTTGDGFLATFDGPARAARCAEGICQAVKPLGLEVRAGCHTGEIEVMGDDVGGLAVHIAARVAAKAKPSEVLVSSTVKDLVAGSALSFVDRGSHLLKGVPGKWRLFAVQ